MDRENGMLPGKRGCGLRRNEGLRKRATAVLSFLLSVLLLAGCASKTPGAETTAEVTVTAPAGPEKTDRAIAELRKLGQSPDDNYRTFYEIFVYSFCDADGDGIGDLQGVISRLDYLRELGINGIWLMPIHPSTTYHKYNVSDYYAVDPQYGTMADFEQLMAECRKRDIHVILDLVVNHTGYQHPWFQEAVSYLQSLPEGAEPNVEDCPYVGYYFFRREPENTAFRQIPNTGWCYEAVFDPEMPDLNWDNPALREEIREIMAFWLQKGVSGFRLDAAKEFHSGSTSKNVEVLRWIRNTAAELNPDCYLVAEVWENFQTIADYYESGIPSIFNFPFGGSDGKITRVLQGAGNPAVVSTFATALEKADRAYRTRNPDYIDAPFLSNHDVGRIAGFAGRDENKMKMAAAMNLFMGGSAFVYYGEEIGMPGSGNDPSKRAPMYWNARGDQGTTNPPPECRLPESYPLGSVEEQRLEDSSLYQYYRKAIAIRNALPQIARGIPTAETALNRGCVAAIRKTWGEESCLILMNIAGEAASVELAGYEDWFLAAELSADGNSATQESGGLRLPAWGVAILLPVS